MQGGPAPRLSRDLVLVGGGHTHALVLRSWVMDPQPGVRLTLIDPGPVTAYSGMLPGFVAGHYKDSDLGIDLVRLARAAGARLILGAAAGIDVAAQTVSLPGRTPIGWDVLSLDIGITSGLPQVPGFAAHGVPAKPLGTFARAWAGWRDRPEPFDIAVIGAGIAGVELALALAWARRNRGGTVTLIDARPLLPAASANLRRRMSAELLRAGIRIVEGAQVLQVTSDAVHLAGQGPVSAAFVVGAAGAVPQPWLAETGLHLTDGFLTVDATLRTTHPAVFAVGDCAHLAESPRPKAGVFAVRQAPVLAHNLRAALTDGPLRPYRPQRDYLKLVSLGEKRALAEKWGRVVAGPALWRWKDRIDRRFMTRFARSPGPAMDCAGCGAKVGRGALSRALAALPPLPRADVQVLPGDDAALILTGAARQVITTDHLSAVTADPGLMARMATVHALGDIWAMGAAPQAAVLSLTLPRLAEPLQDRTLTEILAAVTDVLGAAGCTLAGGHTTEGDGLTIGLTVTGLCDEPPITLGGGQAGDALILTKPLGVGTILAAEMRGLAGGADVAACWASMVQPQGVAARLLARAHAMTDVTGFGLAGHLAGICGQSGLGAMLHLGAIPFLPGALELAEAGVRSSLWPANRADAGAVTGADGPRGALLFDPQTCGGLLAAVDAGAAAPLVAALREAGYPAAVIGALVAGPPVIRCA